MSLSSSVEVKKNLIVAEYSGASVGMKVIRSYTIAGASMVVLKRKK
ncbi:MAG: hypothetical protein Q4A75_04950 [Peptostreptococcaceae bacterium]|nr:hypothetical protein [Peptostreptococcaceae bacterium]